MSDERLNEIIEQVGYYIADPKRGVTAMLLDGWNRVATYKLLRELRDRRAAEREAELEQSAISAAQKHSAGVIGQNEARKEILQLALDMAQADVDREARNLQHAEWKQRSAQDAAVLWRNEYMAAKQAVARANARRDVLVRQAIEVWGEDK